VLWAAGTGARSAAGAVVAAIHVARGARVMDETWVDITEEYFQEVIALFSYSVALKKKKGERNT
jgi:hypothetical protein